MPNIIGILLFHHGDLKNKYIDTSWMSWLLKSTITNEIIDACRQIVYRLEERKMVCIDFDNMSKELSSIEGVVCFCFKDSEGYASIIMTKNYPCKRVAQELSYKIVKDRHLIEMQDYEELFKQYDDPRNIDKLAKIKDELDRTKETLNISIEKVLERGGNIEELIEKTDELSMNSEIFFKKAEQLNSCCIIL